jgi:hypothetical protein
MQAAPVLKHKSDEGVEMYATTFMNVVPTIQRDGRSILGAWDHNCDLTAMDRAFRKVQHA